MGVPALTAPGSAAEARRAAQEILTERRFRAGPIPRPLEGVLHAIGVVLDPIFHAIRRAFDSVAGVIPGGDFVLWAILAALLLGAIAVLTLHGTRRVLAEPAGAWTPAGPRRTSPQALEASADAAERDGRLQEAVRLRFQAGLMRLAEADVIDPASATPNAQLRRMLRSERFDALARRFDEIVYGGDEARAEDIEAARREWPRLVGDRR